MLQAGLDVHGLAHISGDGLLNLLRLDADVEYHLDALPVPQPVFEAVQRRGDVSLAEMYRVYNMGVGFCAVVPASSADEALAAITAAGGRASVIGTVREGTRRVLLPQQGLIGEGERLRAGVALCWYHGPMQVLLGSPRGFCAGVVRAIDIVELALERFGAPVYVRHEIVHNKYVVDSLRRKGAVFSRGDRRGPERLDHHLQCARRCAGGLEGRRGAQPERYRRHLPAR